MVAVTVAPMAWVLDESDTSLRRTQLLSSVWSLRNNTAAAPAWVMAMSRSPSPSDIGVGGATPDDGCVEVGHPVEQFVAAGTVLAAVPE